MKVHNKYELQQALLELKMTKTELSRITGISYSMICYLEKGERIGSKVIWQRINDVICQRCDGKSLVERLQDDMMQHGKDVLVNVTLSKTNFKSINVTDYEILKKNDTLRFVTTASNLYRLITGTE